MRFLISCSLVPEDKTLCAPSQSQTKLGNLCAWVGGGTYPQSQGCLNVQPYLKLRLSNMENAFLNGLKCILRVKNFNKRGFTPPFILFPRYCLRSQFKPLAFSAPPPLHKQPLWFQPFLYIYSVVFSSLGNVLCMIQTLIYIYSCNTVNVTKKASR